MPTKSAIAQQFIQSKVRDVCTRHGVPHDSALAARLEAEAEISDGGRDPFVQIPVGSIDYSLDERMDQLKRDPEYASCIPKPLPKVAKTDTEALRQNFDLIAAGKVRVE